MVKKYLLIFLGILLISGVFAGYQLGAPKFSISDSYAKGANISGWVNMKFNDEPAGSLFEDSNGNSITLIDLLESDAKHDYSCIPEDCQGSYSAVNPATAKTISMNAGSEKIIGFKLDSEIGEISDFTLNINSNVGEQCANQLKIDLFADGTNDAGNTKIYLPEKHFCTERNYGCFDKNEQSIQEALMTGNVYCQRVNLPEAPGFELGAWMKLGSGSANLKMNLYDIEADDFAASCDLPAPTTQGKVVSCDIEYLTAKSKNYYACLSKQGGGSFYIRGYVKDKCGFPASPQTSPEEVASYEMYARPKSFASIANLEIKNELQNGELISSMIEDYLYENYGGLSCTEGGCIIPIKLISGFQQTLTITGVLEYTDEFLGGTQTNILYDLSESSALVNSNMQKIYLDKGGFKVPAEKGAYEFKLKFKGDDLFSKQVNVTEGISIISLTPKKTAVNLPTAFKIKTEDEEKIKKYEWDFGDQTPVQTSTTSQSTHTYKSLGSYSIKIKIEDINGVKSSKTFDVSAGSAGEILEGMLIEKQEALADIKNQILEYDAFSAKAVENVLDLENVEIGLNEISQEYALLDEATESEYGELLSRLLEIDLPEYAAQTSSFDSFTFYPDKENIDLEIISSTAGGVYDLRLEDEYRDAILAWNIDNIETKISIKEFSANYGFGEEVIARTFDADIKNLGQETAYLFAGENLKFDEEKTYEDGYYSESLGAGKNLKFFAEGDISAEELPLFVSPSLDSLAVKSIGKAGKKFKWGLFIFIVLIIILAGFAVYLLLKRWYDKKYENYLFRDKNDLYNLVRFAQSAKQQGKNDREIFGDLRKSKWSAEQINYVLRKYSGKRTGLPWFKKKAVSKMPHPPKKQKLWERKR